jgi:hypothetical protein
LKVIFLAKKKKGKEKKESKPAFLVRSYLALLDFFCIVLNKVLYRQSHCRKVMSPFPGSDLKGKSLQKHVIFPKVAHKIFL